MVIANIAGERFVLANTQDAEALLQIMGRAAEVYRSYLGTPPRAVLVQQGRPDEISISLFEGELLSEAQFAKRRAAWRLAPVSEAQDGQP